MLYDALFHVYIIIGIILGRGGGANQSAIMSLGYIWRQTLCGRSGVLLPLESVLVILIAIKKMVLSTINSRLRPADSIGLRKRKPN